MPSPPQLDRDEELEEEEQNYNGTCEVPLFQEREERAQDGGMLDIREVIVFEDNANAVEVFRLCVVEGVGAGFGVIWTGINPTQSRSACDLLRLPKKDWPDIINDVSFMGDVVANARNERQTNQANR